MPDNYFYTLYGLHIQSEIPCPGLLAGPHSAEVQVRRGLVQERLDDPREKGYKFQAKPGKLLINTNSIAKILISDGDRILVEPRPGAEDYEVRLLLLGWGFGGLLQQRDLLPLHGGAVNVDGRCLVYCADPQGGKSTLTAAFAQHGYPFLGDNIVALQDIAGKLVANPGYPQIYLWADSLAQLDIEPVNLQPIRPRLEKYALDFDGIFQETPLPIGAIYILATGGGGQFELRTLSGPEKLTALADQVFGKQFTKGLGKRESQFKFLLKLAKQIKVIHARIPSPRLSPGDLVDVLLDDYSSIPPLL
jgi:hypothetical protein